MWIFTIRKGKSLLQMRTTLEPIDVKLIVPGGLSYTGILESVNFSPDTFYPRIRSTSFRQLVLVRSAEKNLLDHILTFHTL